MEIRILVSIRSKVLDMFCGFRPQAPIDFGDAPTTYRIAELAIACAYAMLDQDDPVSVAAEACRGYREFTPIADAEATYLFDLILARLATSVCIAASQPQGNPQHHDTETAAWNLLEKLMYGDTDRISHEIACAAGFVDDAERVVSTLRPALRSVDSGQ
jgi:Ser/Thr protein kinase RdoA (MazF antagonist)